VKRGTLHPREREMREVKGTKYYILHIIVCYKPEDTKGKLTLGSPCATSLVRKTSKGCATAEERHPARPPLTK